MIAREHDSVSQAGSPNLNNNFASISIDPQERRAQLLLHRSNLTETLAASGLQPWLVFERAQTYQELGYPDLAAADTYLALTLAETGLDPDHSDLEPVTIVDDKAVPWPPQDGQDDALDLKIASMKLLAACLVELGCLQDAYEFCLRLEEGLEDDEETKQEQRRLFDLIRHRYQATHGKTIAPSQNDSLDLASIRLPNAGFARREVYSWNDHEPDRSSPAALQELNKRLKAVAPDLEVRSAILPVLHDPAIQPLNHQKLSPNLTTTLPSTSLQLGLFATRPLPPNTPILRERSTITATRTLHASLCDNCCSPLPSLSSTHPPTLCENCADAVFCSPACHSLAQSLYHPILCDNDDGIDDIGREPLSKTPAEDLHFLLITRTLAMAAHQGMHPLDLPEVKYLWGDFVPSPTCDNTDKAAQEKTLPFTFQHSIVLPFRFFSTLALTHPELSPGSPLYLHNYDAWVVATLFAKCRGVASARQSTWDGRPEVAAVHPMWCLANHSCNPSVGWVWGEAKADTETETGGGPEKGRDVRGDSEIVYRVRDKPVWKRPSDTGAEQRNGAKPEVTDEWQGIKAGEEILNHYCDVRLPVQERREWASGALGGHCMCERCVWESLQEERKSCGGGADTRVGE